MSYRRLSGLCFSAIAVCGLLQPAAAKADLVLEFGQDGVVGVRDFVVQPGSEFSVEIHLTQQGTFEPSPGFVIPDTRLTVEGLGSATFLVAVDLPGIRHASVETFQFGPGFFDGGSSKIVPNSDDRDLEAGSFGRVVDPPTVPDLLIQVDPVFATPGSNSVLLGIATLIADADFVGTGVISISELNQIAFSLGPDVFKFVRVGSASASVTAVPEPGSLIALTLLSAAGVVYRRRIRSTRT